MDLRFVSANPFKIAETVAILTASKYNIITVNIRIEELQTYDIDKLIRDKVLKAFQFIGRPVFVEHTALYLDDMKGLPGPLTQLVWDRLGPDEFARVFGKMATARATASTVIGYCDGRKIHIFKGSITGKIADKPRGSIAFQWDVVFVPDSHTQTLSEMGSAKNAISGRRKALNELEAFLSKVRRRP